MYNYSGICQGNKILLSHGAVDDCTESCTCIIIWVTYKIKLSKCIVYTQLRPVLVKTKKNQFNARTNTRTWVRGAELVTYQSIEEKCSKCYPLSHLLLAH